MLFAEPWWVNLLLGVPLAVLWWGRTRGHDARGDLLGWLAVWGVAFGCVEAAVVIDLRAIYAVTLGHPPTVAAVAHVSEQPAAIPLESLPSDLLGLEVRREIATIIMLGAAAMLAARRWPARLVAFLWMFAIWDLSYYFWLWWTIRWPASPTTPDVLFLIPRPWNAPVWFPVLVSSLTVVAILAARRTPSPSP